MEEVAASGAAMNGCSAIHLSIFGMNPVVKHGTPDQQQRYLPRIADGTLRPIVDAVLPMADIASAHERMERNDTFGKLVLAWD